MKTFLSIVITAVKFYLKSDILVNIQSVCFQSYLWIWFYSI